MFHHHLSQHVYTTAAIRDLERLAAAKIQAPSPSLIERAAKTVFTIIRDHYPDCQRVAVFVGSGNNGLDGLHTAALLKNAGIAIRVFAVSDAASFPAIQKAAHALELRAIPFDASISLQDEDLVIDAIVGIGLKQTLRPETQAAVDCINLAKKPCIAIDIPTGIDADSGEAQGRPIMASDTVTMLGLKPGLITNLGIMHAGRLHIASLNVGDDEYRLVKPLLYGLSSKLIKEVLPARHANWHKKLSGHVLLIGGSVGFAGAIKMSALAALRAGAGLVSVLTAPEHAHYCMQDVPEIMCHPWQKDANTSLAPFLSKVQAIVAGPGLGFHETAKALLQEVYQHAGSIPLLLDADALLWLVTSKERGTRTNCVITPHPGEAAHLLNASAHDVQQNRLQMVRVLQELYQCTVVLKGARTLIDDGKEQAVSIEGNSGMATAGTGDVLSGIIGAFLAEGLAPFTAACAGVATHSLAGDRAVQQGKRGLIATDLIACIREAVN